MESDGENNSDTNDMNEDVPSPHGTTSSLPDQEDAEHSQFPSMAAILFGNIDADGKLTDNNFLDDETKEKLSGLSTLLGKDNDCSLFDTSDEKESNEILDEGSAESEPFVEGQKADDAKDYSNMEEAMSDDTSSDDDESDDEKETINTTDNSKYPDNLNNKPVEDDCKDEDGTIKVKSSDSPKKEGRADSPFKEGNIDSELMPPPPGPGLQAKVSTPTKALEKEYCEEKPKMKPAPVVKPLASMMPEKYRGVNVRSLFPEFRENQVLRFSRLFPVKDVNKPNIWKNVKRMLQKSDGESDEPKEKKFRPYSYENSFPPLPDPVLHPEAYCEDQAVRFHSAVKDNTDDDNDGKNESDSQSKGPKPSDWRHGPAQYWYDMLNLPENIEKFDYNLQIADAVDNIPKADEVPKQEPETSHKLNDEGNDSCKIEFPPDAFLMVTQLNWEEDVIWNGDDIKHKVLQKLNSKTNAAGWVPSSFNRTAGAFSGSQGSNKAISGLPGVKLQTMQHKKPTDGDDTWNSIFPVENEELSYGRWEDEIIWDHEKMPVKLEPRMVSMDPNDDNIILGIPEDIDPSTLPSDEPVRKVKIIQKHVKKSRMLLNRSGIISVIEEESPPPPPKHVDKDPYNISNDEFYVTKTQESLIKVATGGGLLQHATPTVQLLAPFIPTHMGPIKLRQFHRWPMKRWSHGPLSDFTKFYGVLPLHKHMKKKAKGIIEIKFIIIQIKSNEIVLWYPILNNVS